MGSIEKTSGKVLFRTFYMVLGFICLCFVTVSRGRKERKVQSVYQGRTYPLEGFVDLVT